MFSTPSSPEKEDTGINPNCHDNGSSHLLLSALISAQQCGAIINSILTCCSPLLPPITSCCSHCQHLLAFSILINIWFLHPPTAPLSALYFIVRLLLLPLPALQLSTLSLPAAVS
jgi:hypothetical protein